MKGLILPPINGLNIIVNDLMCVRQEYEQTKFPKSKKKRIRKKWRKRSDNWAMVTKRFFIQMGRDLYMSQLHFDLMKDTIL